MMTSILKIVLYCPDTHVEYDGAMPEERGLGGGKTAQIRLCRAFAALGHDVTLYGNPPKPGTFDRVTYRPFSEADRVECDLFIASSTGGTLDLGPVARLKIDSPHRVIWAQGPLKADSLWALSYDYLYLPSNYMRGIAESRWEISPEKLFVVYNGIEEEYFAEPGTSSAGGRDPFACVYLGYPQKGLGHAREVLRRLRTIDPRFHLDVIGGHELRQEKSSEVEEEPGLVFRGLLGQRMLARELSRYTYCIALQQRPEPFGIVVIEAQRAGVVVVASKVGAFPELIRDGINGFLIGAEAGSPASYDEATELISFLSGAPDVVGLVRGRASSCPWSWDLLSRTWLAHRAGAVSRAADETDPDRLPSDTFQCPICRTPVAVLPDGHHCTDCGRFFPSIGGITTFQADSGGYSELGRPRFLRLLAQAASTPWRKAVSKELADGAAFLPQYILDDSRADLSFLLDLSQEATVLDLGAGYGTISSGFARACRVYALDNDLPRLTFCAERFSQDRQEIHLVHGDGECLPFVDQLFDAVIMIGVLEWAGVNGEEDPVAQQLRFLSESHRVLKPGGALLIGIENSVGFEYLLGKPDDHTGIPHITYLSPQEADRRSLQLRGKPYRVRTHSRREYAQLLDAAGLEKQQFFWAYPDYRLWSALVPLEHEGPCRHFLERLPMLNRADIRDRGLLGLRTAAARTGLMADFVGSYVILARKGA